MKQKIFQIALVVEDYDAAIQFYCKKLNFKLIEDTVLNPEKRWVVVAPPGGEGCQLLWARASGEEQLSRVGNQTGGRVFLFMHTDDLDTYYQRLVSQGITIVRPPSSEPYGKVLVFADLYGNLWDLIEPISPD